MEAITGGFHNLPVARFDGRSYEVIVARQDRLHRLRVLLPQAGAAFQVGKQEG